MEETLSLQLDFSTNLLKSLERVVSSYETLVDNSSEQIKKITELASAIKESEKIFDNTIAKSKQILDSITGAANKDFASNIAKSSQQASKEMQACMIQASKQYQAQVQGMLRSTKSLKRSEKDLEYAKRSLKEVENFGDDVEDFTSEMNGVCDDMQSATEELKNLDGRLDKMKESSSSMTSKLGKFFIYLKIVLGALSIAANVMTSLIGAAAKFYAFTMTIPFTIASIAVKTGNAIRTDLVEVIQSAGEEAKEAFDLTSQIGQGAEKLTRTAKGLLKTFQNPASRLAQLFGTGAAGAAAFLKETFKSVEQMGHYGEVFGGSIMGNVKHAQMLAETQKAIGIGAKEMGHYAMEAYLSGQHPVKYLIDLGTKMKTIAEQNGLDTKAIAKEFHKLKTNIVDFGHLTSTEVVKLTVQLRKMGVKTEDAINVFKKFSTFEEAAKASAMLAQSFQMNVDAFDLINSRDPGEMLKQFREAMFQTGRSFKDLNRHEKALMTSITGISEQGLSSLMGYMSYGLTYDEARKKMEQQDPTKQQTKMLKGLTSTIKQFQKIVQFSSPFDAFFQGLSENQLAQGEFQELLTSINTTFKKLYDLGLNLKREEIQRFTGPVVAILIKIKDMLTGGEIKKLLSAVTKTASDFLGDVKYDLLNSDGAKSFHLLRVKLHESLSMLNDNHGSALKSMMLSSAEDSLKSFSSNIDDASPEALKDVIKKNKDGTYSFVKGLTVDKIINSLEKASDQAKASGNNLILGNIKQLQETLLGVFDDEVAKSLNKDQLKKIENKVYSTTSVLGRIDKLYDNIISMFDEEGDLFVRFSNLARKIMGSLIKGAMQGITAFIHLFSGGLDKAVHELGFVTEDELKKAFPGVSNVKEISLLQWLGISENVVNDLENGLEAQTDRFMKNLPKLASTTSKLLGDMKDLFMLLAGSILGVIGDFTLTAYEKGTMKQRAMMRIAGFKPTAAKLAQNKKDKVKYTGTTDELFDLLLKNQDDQEVIKVGIVGDLITFIQGYSENIGKNTYAHKFLTSQKILDDIEHLKLDGGGAADDYDEEERSRNLTQIIRDAKDLEYLENIVNFTPRGMDYSIKNKFINKLNEKGIVPDEGKLKALYGNLLNRDYKTTAGRSGGFIDYFGPLVGIDRTAEDIREEIEEIMKQDDSFSELRAQVDSDIRRRKEATSKQPGQKKGINVKDFYAQGKGMQVILGSQTFDLHDEDTLIAFKSDGFFTRLINSVASKYLDNIKSLNTNMDNVKVENTKLKESIKSIDEIKDGDDIASEEEVVEIFNMFKEVVENYNSREIIVNDITEIIYV